MTLGTGHTSAAVAVHLVLPLLMTGCSEALLDDLRASALVLEAPPALDLGTLPTGEPAETRFEITNVGEQSVELVGMAAEPPSPGVTLSAELDPGPLPPGARAVVTVWALAERQPPTDRLGYLVLVAGGLAPDDPRLPRVEVRGSVSVSGLEITPNPVSIGPVPFTHTGTAVITIRNLRRNPVRVYAVRHDGQRAMYDEALSRGTFGPLPEVDPNGSLTTIPGEGETFEVELSYTAPEDALEAKEQALWSITTCADGADPCGASVVVQGLPDLEGHRAVINPTTVSFGSVPVGERVDMALTISNDGLRPLILEDVYLEGSERFRVPVEALEGAAIRPDEPLRVDVTYQPLFPRSDNATLRFRTNDPVQPNASVTMAGLGVNLPPCRFSASPIAVNFGLVEVAQASIRAVSIANNGTEDCLMFNPRILPNPGTEDGAFVLEASTPQSVRLRPGQSHRFYMRFLPVAPGRRSATLRLRTGSGESISVGLVGGTLGTTLDCTPEQSTLVERPITVRAYPPTGRTPAIRWQVRTAPTAASGPSWRLSPGTPTYGAAELTPLVVGTYVLEAQAETEEGDPLSCQAIVNARSAGLHVNLTWDGPGDLDLHLSRGGNAPWYGANDCHFENMAPQWVTGQGAGTGANPKLDRDDTSGEGPENITIAEPTIGTRYTVAVSHFERAAGRTARIQVFCGRASSVLDVTSRRLRGDQTGRCSTNDFWTVAAISFFASDQCDIELIDEYQSSYEACGLP